MQQDTKIKAVSAQLSDVTLADTINVPTFDISTATNNSVTASSDNDGIGNGHGKETIIGSCDLDRAETCANNSIVTAHHGNYATTAADADAVAAAADAASHAIGLADDRPAVHDKKMANKLETEKTAADVEHAKMIEALGKALCKDDALLQAMGLGDKKRAEEELLLSIAPNINLGCGGAGSNSSSSSSSVSSNSRSRSRARSERRSRARRPGGGGADDMAEQRRSLFHQAVGGEFYKQLRTSSICVRGLELHKCGAFGVQAACALAEALSTNTNVISLNLGGSHSIQEEGARALGNALRTNASLAALDIYSNRAGDTGAIAIAAALRVGHSCGRRNGDGISSRNSIRKNSSSSSSSSSSSIIGLHRTTSSVNTGSDYTYSYASRNIGLQVLNMGLNRVGSAGARALGEALCTNASLSTLMLQQNNIGEDGACALAEALLTNTALTTLNLGYAIDAGGARALAEALQVNTGLRSLDLSNCSSIGPGGGQALGQALRFNSSLQILRLTNTYLGDDGVRPIGDALADDNQSLLTLDVSYNDIGPAGAIALARALLRADKHGGLETLVMNNNSVGTEGAVALANAVRGHRNNRRLKTLKLRANNILAEGASALADALCTNVTLRVLRLQCNGIGDAGVTAFAETLRVNSTLEELALYDIKGIGEKGARALNQALHHNLGIQTLLLSPDLSKDKGGITGGGNNGGGSGARGAGKSRPVELDGLLAAVAAHCRRNRSIFRLHWTTNRLIGNLNGAPVYVKTRALTAALCLLRLGLPFYCVDTIFQMVRDPVARLPPELVSAEER